MSRNRGRPLPPEPGSDGYEVPVNRRQIPDTDDDNLYESIPDHENARKMVVKKLPRGVSIDTIEMYFESKRKMGRDLEVRNVDLNADDNEAIVTFASTSDVQYVLERHKSCPCEIQKQMLVVEPLNIPDTVDHGESDRSSQNYSDMYEYGCLDDNETDTIEVRNLSDTCSEDTLTFYFENTRRSGGGEIISKHINRDEGYAQLQFKDKSVVQRVIEKGKKESHKLGGRVLSVSPFVISKTELLLEEVPDTVNEENVSLFIEAKLKIPVISVVFNQDRTKVLVQLQKAFDFKNVTEMLKKHKLGGVNVVPVQIPVTSGIVVTNLPEDTTNDSVEMYFENSRRSNGGPVQNVELHIEDGYCLVFFKDMKVVKHVCEKNDHQIHSQHVDVKPYNKYFGLSVEVSDCVFQLPEPLSLKDIDPYKLKFLKEKDEYRKKLEQKLGKCNGRLFFDDTPATIECTLTLQDKPSKLTLKNWSINAMDCVKQFTDDLEVTVKEVDFNFWDAIRRELNSLHFPNPDDIVIITEKDRSRIIFVTHNAVSDCRKIEMAIDSAVKEEQEKNFITTEEKVLDRWKITYLKASNFEDDMKHAHGNVQIKFEEKKEKGRIIISGPKRIITEVLLDMFQSLQSVKSKDIELEEEEIELLQNDATREKVKKQMSKKHVSDVWEAKHDKVILYADDDDGLAKMETVINNTLAKFTISLDSGKESVLKSDKWEATKRSLENRFSGCFVISIHDTQLDIFTLADIQDKVSDELQTFLSKNVTYKEQMSLTPHVISCFKHVIRNRYEQEIHALKDKGLNVKINLNEKSGAVMIEGTSEEMNEAKRMIKRLQDKIEIKQHKIEQPKIKKYFDCRHGKDCVKSVESTTPCVIDMQGSAFKRSFHLHQSSGMVKFDKPTICAEAVLDSGIKVLVVGGDITELQVEVLVNAANTELKHAGGLAAVIVNKGGRAIQRECEDYIRNNGSLSEGEVFMSSGGKLRCKRVAHAVGPHWRGGKDGEECCLQEAVFACIEKTEKERLASIALPALSAGMFQYPVNLSCLAIAKAIDQHFQRSKSCIKEVYLCDISKATVCAFTNALQVIAPNLSIRVDLRQGDGRQQGLMINSDDDKNRRQSPGRFKNINIEVVKGELAKEQVNVIVNSTSPDLQLQRGALSKAILKAGGRNIQEECDQNYPDGIKVGEVAVSSAGKLQCSKIYHIAIKHFDSKSPRVCLQGLNECVTACMEEADNNGLTSISFPAMGTGAQKYPKDKVAREMFKAVSDYGSKFPSTSVKSVRFVIYSQDDDTYESFVTEEKHWKGDDDHKPLPVIRKPSKSIGTLVNESRGRAEFQVGKMKILIHEGDITDDNSEAIVASCNMDLDLSKGAVTKAILRKGGDAIGQDCKQQKSTMKNEGIAITTAGKLKAKYIIHVDTKYKTRDWPPVVLNCLKKAEKHKFSSIAFPALGTSVGCKAGDIADVICTAISEFQKDGPVNLQKIKIIIFQTDMLSDFITGMKNSIVGGRPHSAHGTSVDKPSHHNRQSHHRQHSTGQPDDVHGPSEDSCTVTIYAENKEKIDKAIKTLQRTADKEWIVKTFEDQGVHRLTNKHIKEIKSMATDNHVDVHVDTDVGVIKVTGLVANVLDVFGAIHNQLRSADNSFYLKGQAKLMSSMVKWIYLKEHKEFPFHDRVNLEIETAYKQKEKTVKVKDYSGGEYVVDFGTMTEHDVKKPNEKFPVIRRDLVAGASFDIPKHWRAMNDKENLKLVTLNLQDSEYQKVMQEFTKTLGRQPSIVKIERIQNKTLYTQYSAKRKEMNNNYKSHNERVLWHGTADYAVASINSHGFNRSYCGKNATAIGQGVYFAVNSNYSDQPTYTPPGSDGNKRMYRCLVLTGKYCTGSSDMRVPPPIDKSKPHILYDSVTNNPSSPGMFVVFNDTQAYPEHIITYR